MEIKFKSHRQTVGSVMSKKKNVISSLNKGSRDDFSKTKHKVKSSRKETLSKGWSKETSVNSSKEIEKPENRDVKAQKVRNRRTQKRQRYDTEVDDASRLQRRTRYLLVKMKLEQNLIDAYSGDGWKGQSREKIKPEKELQRANKQILKCKLGIREAIRQLDLLSSVGCIDDSAIAPDGSVHHEHIICAKCKLREAFPDNDIILCDGTCNCAFHQKCLDPPLLTENIPPGDQGWFCRFCECKMEMLESMNAHLGTRFSTNSSWQDIFKEEAALPDGGDALRNPEQEWPSDDSQDDDYDPEEIESSCSCSRAGSECDASDDASSSSSLWLLENKMLSESVRVATRNKGSQDTFYDSVIHIESDGTTDCEIITGPRQRRAVDYKTLYDEMFGKDAPTGEQMSEDEDWGPAKRNRRKKESDAANTLVTLSGSNRKFPITNTQDGRKKTYPSEKIKRSIFRIPPRALQKLRLVFAENELPSRAVKEDLSQQLGLESEKVNKWFKNARYMALKSRKGEKGKDRTDYPLVYRDIPSANVVCLPKYLEEVCRRKYRQSLTRSLKTKRHKGTSASLPNGNQADLEFGDDVSLKLLKSFAKGKKKIELKPEYGNQDVEAELERLCTIKGQVEKLQQVLLGIPYLTSDKAVFSNLKEQSVIYVPVAELKEKG